MKICLLFLFAFIFHTMATDSNAQDAIVSLKSNSATVSQLINEIEKQTDYLVVYSNREVDTNRTVNFQNRSNKVSIYLDEAFSNTDIGYDFENDYIVLSKKAHQNTIDITRLIETAQQQGSTIKGKVTDENGEPVIGATIVVQGDATKGTVTDIDGRFTISNVNENATLDISFIGMISQSIPLSGRTTINITLIEDIEILDEVVVVGYGTQRRANLTGAISSVGTDKIQTTTHSSLAQKLQGKVSGLNIRQNSGQP